MSSLFPRYEDVFTVKRNETGDGTGHYVMAEDVNALQDAIVAVEKTLGTMPSGSYQNVRDRIAALEIGSKPFKLPSLCIYNGDPFLVNNSGSMAEAADILGFFSYVILSANIENPSNPLRNKAIQVIERASSTKFLGTVDTSVGTIDSVKIKIQALNSMGAKGVYLDKFGYEHGNDRARQNNLLKYVHSLGMFALFSSQDPANILSDSYASGKNPEYKALDVNTSDGFIHFGFGEGNFQAISEALIRFREQTGIKLFALSNSSDYDYKQALAILYSYDGFYAQDETYGSDNNVAINQIIPISGDFYAQRPVVISRDGKLIRHTKFGSICIDIENKTFDFDNIKIPGYLIDAQSIETRLTADSMAPEVIQAINSDKSTGLIDADKIGTFEIVHVDKISSAVIEAINLRAGYINADKIESKIVEALSITSRQVNAEVVNAGLAKVLDLIAESGDFNRISTNLINAINANIENATIHGARIRNLDASAITSGYISVQRIAPESIHAEMLSIGLMKGVDAWRYTYLFDNSITIEDLTPEFFQGKVESGTLEVEDTGVIYLHDIMRGPIPSHVGLIETNLVVRDSIPASAISISLSSNVPHKVFIDELAVLINKDNVMVIPQLTNGIHKVQIVYRAASENPSFTFSRKLSQKRADNPGRYIIDGLQRMDCYVENTTRIEGGKITTRSIDAEQLKTNTITADSAVIAEAAITNAMIKEINADKITAGDITAERIKVAALEAMSTRIKEIIADTLNAEKAEIRELSADVIEALNFYGENITADMATIDAAVIGELEVENLKAEVINAVSARIQDLVADRVTIGDAEIKNLSSELIKALNIHAESIEANEALIDSAVIGELTADKIKAAAVEALTARIQELTAENAFVRNLASEIVNAINVRAESIEANEALFSAATIGELTAEQIQANIINALKIAVGDITGDDATFKRLVADLITTNAINAVNVKITSTAGSEGNDALLTIDKAGMVIASKPKASEGDAYWPIDAQVLVINKDGIGVSIDGGRTWQFKMTGNGLYVADGHILNVSANKLTAGDIKATESIRFIGRAGANGDGLIIDDTGLTVYDTGNKDTAQKLVKIASSGIEISDDGGTTWSTKLDGGRLYVDNADINNLEAGKITAGNITANGTINVGNGVALSNDGILVTGAKGIEITEGSLHVTEGTIERVKLGKLGAGDYGLKLTTTGNKTITLNKSGLSADNFSIGSDGNVSVTGNVNADSGYLKNLSVQGSITVTQGGSIDTESVQLNSAGLVVKAGKSLAVGSNFSVDSTGKAIMSGANVSGIIEASGGLFGTKNDKHILVDAEGLILGSGSIVDTRDVQDQRLRLDTTHGLTVTKGTIGGVIIGNSGLIAGATVITDNGLQVTGPEGIVVEDGDIRIRDNQTGDVYVTAGQLPAADGLPASRGIEIRTPGSSYRMRLDGYGTVIQTALNQKVFSVDTDGNLVVTGMVNAKDGYFGNQNVYVNSTGIVVGAGGNITVNGGAIKAGTTVTIDNSGLKITNGAAGINVNDLFTVSGAGSMTAKLGTIAGISFDDSKLTAGSVVINKSGLINIGSGMDLGLIDTDVYGLKVKGANPITITGAGIASTNFNVDTSTGNVSMKGEIKATSGWFGTSSTNSVYIDGSGLKFTGTGSISGNGFTLSSSGLSLTGGTGTVINLNGKFTVDSAGNFTAVSGAIAGVSITENGLVGDGVSFSKDGISVSAGKGITVTNGKITIKDGATDLITLGATDLFTGIKINTATPITIGSNGIQSTNFKLNADGTVSITGNITADSGSFTGSVKSNDGYFGAQDNGVKIDQTGLQVIGTGSIRAGKSTLNSSGVFLGEDTSIVLKDAQANDVFTANSAGITAVKGSIGGWTIDSSKLYAGVVSLNSSGTISTGKVTIDGVSGKLTATDVDLAGKVIATSGQIGGWFIDANGIYDAEVSANRKISITPTVINVNSNLLIGRYDASNYGIRLLTSGGKYITLDKDGLKSDNLNIAADGNVTISGSITATGGKIGSWNIGESLTSANGSIILDATGNKITIKEGTTEQVVIGNYTGTSYGLKAGGVILNSSGLAISGGAIDITTAISGTQKLTINSSGITAIKDSNNKVLLDSNGLSVIQNGVTKSAITSDGIYGTLLTDNSVSGGKFDTLKPKSVTGVAATSAIEQLATNEFVNISVSWVNPTQNVDNSIYNDAAGCKVYLKEGSGQLLCVAIVPDTSTSYIIRNVKPNTTYTVAVSAYDKTGNESLIMNGENLIAGTYANVTTAKDLTPPAATGSITILDGTRMFAVSWPKSTAYDLAYYQVQRCDANLQAGPFSSWADVVNTLGTQIVDKDLVYGKWYKYRVRAVDTSGNTGAWSTETTARQPSDGLGTDILASSITSEYLSIGSVVKSIDPATATVFHFDGTLQSNQGIKPMEGSSGSFRRDGRFGGALATEEVSENILAKLTNGNATFKSTIGGWTLATGAQYVDTGGVDGIGDGYVNVTNVGTVSIQVTPSSTATHTISVYAKIVNTAANLVVKAGSTTLLNQALSTEWKRYTAQWTPASTNPITLSFASGSGVQVSIDSIQLEAKPYATSFMNASRDTRGGVNYQASSIMLPDKGTISFWLQSIIGLKNTVSNGSSESSTDNLLVWGTPGQANCLWASVSRAANPSLTFYYNGIAISSGTLPVTTGYEWVHVAFTWKAGAQALFINGNKVKTTTAGAISLPSDDILRIGYRENYASASSMFDELRVDRIVVDDDEITSWYKQKSSFYDAGAAIDADSQNISAANASVTINQEGIVVRDGKMEVISEDGQVLITGGRLQVNGLDIGIAQSENQILNGNFRTVDTTYGFTDAVTSEYGIQRTGAKYWISKRSSGPMTERLRTSVMWFLASNLMSVDPKNIRDLIINTMNKKSVNASGFIIANAQYNVGPVVQQQMTLGLEEAYAKGLPRLTAAQSTELIAISNEAMANWIAEWSYMVTPTYDTTTYISGAAARLIGNGVNVGLVAQYLGVAILVIDGMKPSMAFKLNDTYDQIIDKCFSDISNFQMGIVTFNDIRGENQTIVGHVGIAGEGIVDGIQIQEGQVYGLMYSMDPLTGKYAMEFDFQIINPLATNVADAIKVTPKIMKNEDGTPMIISGYTVYENHPLVGKHGREGMVKLGVYGSKAEESSLEQDLKNLVTYTDGYENGHFKKHTFSFHALWDNIPNADPDTMLPIYPGGPDRVKAKAPSGKLLFEVEELMPLLDVGGNVIPDYNIQVRQTIDGMPLVDIRQLLFKHCIDPKIFAQVAQGKHIDMNDIQGVLTLGSSDIDVQQMAVNKIKSIISGFSRVNPYTEADILEYYTCIQNSWPVPATNKWDPTKNPIVYKDPNTLDANEDIETNIMLMNILVATEQEKAQIEAIKLVPTVKVIVAPELLPSWTLENKAVDLDSEIPSTYDGKVIRCENGGDFAIFSFSCHSQFDARITAVSGPDGAANAAFLNGKLYTPADNSNALWDRRLMEVKSVNSGRQQVLVIHAGIPGNAHTGQSTKSVLRLDTFQVFDWHPVHEIVGLPFPEANRVEFDPAGERPIDTWTPIYITPTFANSKINGVPILPKARIPIKYKVRIRVVKDSSDAYPTVALVTGCQAELGTNPSYVRETWGNGSLPTWMIQDFDPQAWDFTGIQPKHLQEYYWFHYRETGVQERHIADGQVTSVKVANSSIVARHIADGNVGFYKTSQVIREPLPMAIDPLRFKYPLIYAGSSNPKERFIFDEIEYGTEEIFWQGALMYPDENGADGDYSLEEFIVAVHPDDMVAYQGAIIGGATHEQILASGNVRCEAARKVTLRRDVAINDRVTANYWIQAEEV